MNIIKPYAVPILAAILLSLASACPARSADSIELLQRQLAAASDDGERALLNKEIGDAYSSQDDLAQAAEFYIKALAKGKFTAEDRLKLADSISWGGKLKEAAGEYRAMIDENPANLKAGVGLARTLFWMNDDAGALKESEKVLKLSPGNKDALLVKANALRRGNKIDEAIGIYKEILGSGQEFDAQSGLAYALLAKGNREAARAAGAQLKPLYPYQEKELKEFNAELEADLRPDAAAEPVPAPEPARPAAAPGNIRSLKKALAAARNKSERARLNKEIGDAYVFNDDLDNAASFYLSALALGRFSAGDRLRMATQVSWGGRLAEAVKEFRALAKENPADLKARIALARTLSWMDDTEGSLAEIEKVLLQAPEDRDALLIKANALRRMNGVKESIEIYNKLLESGADFDTQSGLAYALLAKGDRDSARAAAASLNAQQPYQQKELNELSAEIEAGTEHAPVAEQVPAPEAGGIEPLKKALAAAKDKDERARLNREIGDAYVQKDDYSHAAGFYSAALSLGHFPAEDRMQMATQISWGDSLPAAAKEFRALARENPSDLKAGIALARTLSWMGDNKGALAEIGKVLKQAPEDRDALLIKANALRLRNSLQEAIAIYSKLLEAGDDFDARSGLAYALLARGDIKAARAAAAPLTAQYPYQERELQALAAELASAASPALDAGYSYYSDTEHNYVRRYTLLYGQWLGSVKAELGLAHVDATDQDRGDSADIVSGGAYRKLSDSVGVGAGLSLDKTEKAAAGNFLTWNVKADKTMGDGAIGVSAMSYPITDTAQLLENNIRAASYGLSASWKLNTRFLLSGAYAYREYSDNNGANDLQGSLSYLLLPNPSLTVGYKCRYFNFRNETAGGYFDPSNYLAHQLFVNLSVELGRFYGFIEPYAGHQAIKRNGVVDNDYFTGGSGTLGFKAGKKISIEANGEGGNYALQSATGFSYYQLGLRVIFIP